MKPFNLKSNNTNFFGCLCLFLILILTISCDKNQDPIDEVVAIDLSDKFGSPVSIYVLGQVINANGDPIENATVSMGTSVELSDNNGVFIFSHVSANKNFAYIKASKSGYIDGSRGIMPTSGVNNVTIQLLDFDILQTIPSGTSSIVYLNEGASIDFPGEFIKEDGSPYSGNVNVVGSYLDASEDIDNVMPGMLYAANASNEERYLETYGMMKVELRSTNDEVLNIDPQYPATIKMPLNSSLASTAPSTIPTWYFDEAKGYWIEEGTADLVGNSYVAEVNHFSWWNCDAPFPLINLCMTLVDPSNNSLSNVYVELSRTGTSWPRKSSSDNNGEVCGKVPKNEILSMRIIDQCGNTVHTASIGPFSADTNLGQMIINLSSGIQKVEGELRQCNGGPVTNGYVTLNYNNETYTSSVQNGKFCSYIISCASSNSFMAKGVDYDNIQTTNWIPYNFQSPITNLGVIAVCDSIDEFISYTLDSDTFLFFDKIACESSNNGFFVQGLNTMLNKFFYLSSNNTVLDTYDFGFQGSGNLMGLEGGDLYPNMAYPNTYKYQLKNWPNVGGYVDITFSGTFYDFNNPPMLRTVNGTIHVKRDN